MDTERFSGTCAHGEMDEDCTTCAKQTRDFDYAAGRMIAQREQEARTSELARQCADVWGCPVRAVEEMHVRTSSHGTGPALSVRWESRYFDGCTPDGTDIYRECVWVPAIDGRDLPWQLSPRIAAKVALEART